MADTSKSLTKRPAPTKDADTASTAKVNKASKSYKGQQGKR